MPSATTPRAASWIGARSSPAVVALLEADRLMLRVRGAVDGDCVVARARVAAHAVGARVGVFLYDGDPRLCRDGIFRRIHAGGGHVGVQIEEQPPAAEADGKLG